MPGHDNRIEPEIAPVKVKSGAPDRISVARSQLTVAELADEWYRQLLVADPTRDALPRPTCASTSGRASDDNARRMSLLTMSPG